MDWLTGISRSELLFYGGVMIMAVSVLTALPTGLVLTAARRRLKRKLEEEYGKPQQ